jgi:hypothetical protein
MSAVSGPGLARFKKFRENNFKNWGRNIYMMGIVLKRFKIKFKNKNRADVA